MNDLRLQPATDNIMQHEIDLQNANDLNSAEVSECGIPPETVKLLRESLNLSTELFALLLGVSVSAMIRYENISIPPFPQGHIARKIGILVGWMIDPKSSRDIIGMLNKENGLSVLAGLLHSESVAMFLQLSNTRTTKEVKENNKDMCLKGLTIFTTVVGRS
jgi:DNA-binding transcriptional regulator YiaG